MTEWGVADHAPVPLVERSQREEEGSKPAGGGSTRAVLTVSVCLARPSVDHPGDGECAPLTGLAATQTTLRRPH
jgi:hypothetical protein